MTTVFRPRLGRVLTATIGVFGAGALIAITVHEGLRAGIASLPWVALFCGAVWATFWRPGVVIDDAGVRLINVFRTITLPWPAIHLIDTKWALTLTTAYGKFTAWAAPAPGGMASRRYDRADFVGLPESTYAAQRSVRPGDNPKSPSGAAALAVRRHWEDLRDRGYLDDPRMEFVVAPVTWHWFTMVGASALAALGVLADSAF